MDVSTSADAKQPSTPEQLVIVEIVDGIANQTLVHLPARREAELAKCIVLCRACRIRRHHEKRQTHCKRGHELTKANLYVKPSSGTGECRTCRSLRRVSSAGGRVPERSKGAAC